MYFSYVRHDFGLSKNVREQLCLINIPAESAFICQPTEIRTISYIFCWNWNWNKTKPKYKTLSLFHFCVSGPKPRKWLRKFLFFSCSFKSVLLLGICLQGGWSWQLLELFLKVFAAGAHADSWHNWLTTDIMCKGIICFNDQIWAV